MLWGVVYIHFHVWVQLKPSLFFIHIDRSRRWHNIVIESYSYDISTLFIGRFKGALVNKSKCGWQAHARTHTHARAHTPPTPSLYLDFTSELSGGIADETWLQDIINFQYLHLHKILNYVRHQIKMGRKKGGGKGPFKLDNFISNEFYDIELFPR